MKPRLWKRAGRWCCGVKRLDGSASWYEDEDMKVAWRTWVKSSGYAIASRQRR